MATGCILLRYPRPGRTRALAIASAYASSSNSQSAASHPSAIVLSSARSSNLSARRMASSTVSSCNIAPHKEQLPRPSGITVSADSSHHRLLCFCIRHHLPSHKNWFLESKPCFAFLKCNSTQEGECARCFGGSLVRGRNVLVQRKPAVSSRIMPCRNFCVLRRAGEPAIIPLLPTCPERQVKMHERI
jgi:hypothetical protein